MMVTQTRRWYKNNTEEGARDITLNSYTLSVHTVTAWSQFTAHRVHILYLLAGIRRDSPPASKKETQVLFKCNASADKCCLEILSQTTPTSVSKWQQKLLPAQTKTTLSCRLLEQKHVMYIQITPPPQSVIGCLLGSVNSASLSQHSAKTRRHRGQSHRKPRRQTTSHPALACLGETLPPHKAASASTKDLSRKGSAERWATRYYRTAETESLIWQTCAQTSLRWKKKENTITMIFGGKLHSQKFKWIKGNNKAT